MDKPQIQYTKSGRINIAYQAFGSGQYDLVYIPGWISNIDLMWRCPQLVYFLEELSKITRVILFDKRGTGLSDRVSDLSPLEERMDDIRAVMDAVGSEKAILFGHSEGGSVSALFSATYPHRTVALITFGVFAKRRYSEDYPWAPTDEERQEVYDMIENHWGSGQMNLESLAPSMKDDAEFMEWLAQYFRSGASPSAAMALTKMNTQIDIIDILSSISVPTLVLFRTNDIDVKIEEGKFFADRIKGAKFVEFPGDDHLFWAGDSKAVLDEMIGFIQNDFQKLEYQTILSTLLKVKINPTQISGDLNEFETILKAKINQFRGKQVFLEGDIMTASFSGPSKAVHCAMEILNAGKIFGYEISQAIHIGEIQLIPHKMPRGLASDIAIKLLQYAKPNDILISETVKYLLSGTGLDFEHFGILNMSESKKLKILLLKDVSYLDEQQKIDKDQFYLTSIKSKNHSFLESVMNCIEENLTNEEFGISTLSSALFMSPRQLQRKIKSMTNKSPNNLIRSVRLHKAKELIIQEGKSIKEAAYDTGFNSISYFTNCFKKEFGNLPSEVV